jgi:cytochrome c6
VRVRTILTSAVLLLASCQPSDTPRGDPEAGAVIVANLDNSCGLCHTLESAGFKGTPAPNLDELRPGYQRVLDAVREGPGLMPPYSGVLTDAELHDIAAFISREVDRGQ